MFLILFVIVLCLYFIVKPQLYWWMSNVKQEMPVPIFGNIYSIIFGLESMCNFVERCYSKFPDERYSGIYFGSTPHLIIKDPNLIKQVLVTSSEFFFDKPDTYVDCKDVELEENVYNLKGSKASKVRSVMIPAFSNAKMKATLKQMEDHILNTIHRLNKTHGDSILTNMEDFLSEHTIDVLAEYVFGITNNSIQDKNKWQYELVRDFANFEGFNRSLKIFLLQYYPRLGSMFKLKIFPEEMSSRVPEVDKENVLQHPYNTVDYNLVQLLSEAKRKSTTEETNTWYSDDIDYQKEKTEKLTDHNVLAQSTLVFFKGFKSLTTLMSFMAYELARNQGVQRKMRLEVDEVNVKCRGNLTYDSLADMSYMDMVISETLRKWPPAPYTTRMCTKPYVIPPERIGEEPVYLNIGDKILIPYIGLQRDAKYFKNPNDFNPERFNEINKNFVTPYTYLPFGVGHRVCLGYRFAILEVKSVFFHLLRKFELHYPAGTPLKLGRGIFYIHSKNGIKLELKKRD